MKRVFNWFRSLNSRVKALSLYQLWGIWLLGVALLVWLIWR